jgi:hypothetical protein
MPWKRRSSTFDAREKRSKMRGKIRRGYADARVLDGDLRFSVLLPDLES